MPPTHAIPHWASVLLGLVQHLGAGLDQRERGNVRLSPIWRKSGRVNTAVSRNSRLLSHLALWQGSLPRGVWVAEWRRCMAGGGGRTQTSG